MSIGSDSASVEVFVPGRLCILGEHTDWIGGSYRHLNRKIAVGLTLVCTTSEGLFARCKAYKPGMLRFIHRVQADGRDKDSDMGEGAGQTEVLEFECALDPSRLAEEARSSGFFAYVAAGLGACMERRLREVGPNGCDALLRHGIEIDNFCTTLPMKKGLSSSAAVCVLVARCFNELVNAGRLGPDVLPPESTADATATATATVGAVEGEAAGGENGIADMSAEVAAAPTVEATKATFQAQIDWGRAAIMDIAYTAESGWTSSKCGRMDQCVAMGREAVGLMEYNGHEPGQLDQLLSSRADHATRKPATDIKVLYNHAPLHFVVGDVMGSKDTVAILRALNACFPFPANSAQSRMHRYAAHSHKNVWAAVAAIESGNHARLGAALTDAQALFDNCAIENCPHELRAPKLHALLRHPQLLPLCFGMKGVGSQGDGSVQLLCRGFREQQEAMQVLRDLGCSCFPLTIPASPASCTSSRPPPAPVAQGPGQPPVRIERPLLLHPNRLRCALVIADGNLLGRPQAGYGHLGRNTIAPCLLPLPFADGTTTFLMSLISELVVTHGVQRIAVVVTASDKQWDSALTAAGASEDDYDDCGPAPMMPHAGKTFSTADIFGRVGSAPIAPASPRAGNVLGTSPSSAPAVPAAPLTEASADTKQFVDAFTAAEQFRDADPSDPDDVRSAVWTPASEELDYLRARTRFFFEDPSHAYSPYSAMIQAVDMLAQAAEKLIDPNVVTEPRLQQQDRQRGRNASFSFAPTNLAPLPAPAQTQAPAEDENPTGLPKKSSAGELLSRVMSFSSSSQPSLAAATATAAAAAAPTAAPAATTPALTLAKHLGPLLVCRAESLPCPASLRASDPTAPPSTDDPPVQPLFSDAIAAMAADWDKWVNLSPVASDPAHNAMAAAPSVVGVAGSAQVACQNGVPVVGLLPSAVEIGSDGTNSGAGGVWHLQVDSRNLGNAGAGAGAGACGPAMLDMLLPGGDLHPHTDLSAARMSIPETGPTQNQDQTCAQNQPQVGAGGEVHPFSMQFSGQALLSFEQVRQTDITYYFFSNPILSLHAALSIFLVMLDCR